MGAPWGVRRKGGHRKARYAASPRACQGQAFVHYTEGQASAHYTEGYHGLRRGCR